MTGEKTAKKDRDPIFTICLIIFAIAAVIAVGAFISNEYFPDNSETASTGDKVTVNYIGTYYDEYGKEHAVVFDTSYANIGNDSNIAKANDFTQKSSYSALSFTVGGTTVLKKFGDSVIGHRVGDKYNIYLSATDAYYAHETFGTLMKTGNTMDTTVVMTKSEFTLAYPDVTLSTNSNSVFTSDYGWEASAIPTNEGKSVLVSYFPTSGETYKVYESGNTVVNYKVTAVADGTITYNIDIQNPTYVDSTNIQMIKLDLGSDVIYITSISGDEITYKGGMERTNQPLYFQIEIVSIE
jgi:hypothetical protein